MGVPAKSEKVTPKAHGLILRKMAGGADFKQVSAALAREKLPPISQYIYLKYCQRQDIKRAREVVAEHMIREGVGDRIRRVEALVQLHDATLDRAIKTLSDPQADPKMIATLNEEVRLISKQISVEAGDWVENINVAAIVRSMSPQQLIAVAGSEEGDVIDSSFAAAQLEAPTEGDEEDDHWGEDIDA